MVVVVKYYGPTDTRVARLRAYAYGHAAKWYDRRHALPVERDMERVAREYARQSELGSVRYVGRLDANVMVFEVRRARR